MKFLFVKLISHKLFTIAFLSLFIANIAFSQEQDARLYAGTEITVNLSPDMHLAFNQEARFVENVSIFDKSISELGLKYNISKHLRIGLTYRLTNKLNKDNYFRQWHRLQLDLRITQKIHNFRISYRTMYQSQYKNILSSKNGFIPDNYLRNRLSLQYRESKKIRPYISAELFTPIFTNKKPYIDEIRYVSGLDYIFNRRYSLGLFYMLQNEMNIKKPNKNHVYGISFNIVL